MAKAAKMIKVEQTGSAIRRHHSQRSTLIGLKLNKIGRVTELQDTPAVRGMIATENRLPLFGIMPPYFSSTMRTRC